MRICIQRVARAKVLVDNKIVGQINRGALVLFGCNKDDTHESVEYLANKLINLRFFSDENDKMNLSLLDIKGEVLIVSQFTLYADCSMGRRPSFTDALEASVAKKYYEEFVSLVKKQLKVETGIFQAKMQVHLVNDGPATFLVDSK